MEYKFFEALIVSSQSIEMVKYAVEYCFIVVVLLNKLLEFLFRYDYDSVARVFVSFEPDMPAKLLNFSFVI